MKLRFHLVALVLATLLPVLAFAVIMIGLFARQEQAAVGWPLQRLLWLTAGGGLLVLALGVGLAGLLGRRLVRPIASLSASAQALGRGEALPPVVGLGNHTVLIARTGRAIPIDDSGAPIRAERGRIVGTVLVFRDIAEPGTPTRPCARRRSSWKPSSARRASASWSSSPTRRSGCGTRPPSGSSDGRPRRRSAGRCRSSRPRAGSASTTSGRPGCGRS